MEKLYEVTFTHQGKQYRVEVEADSQADAINQAQEIGFGEDWRAKLIAIDNEYFN